MRSGRRSRGRCRTIDRPGRRRHQRVYGMAARSGSPLALQYANHLVGQQVAVSPQTVAEARYGALKAGWGPRRLRDVEQMTNRVRVLDVDGETIEQLRNQCRLIGHALHQRFHNADLWIAAAAVRWNLPLVAHDAIVIGCPGLDLRTKLATD
jgi:predicted nucleic acid-binding protein